MRVQLPAQASAHPAISTDLRGRFNSDLPEALIRASRKSRLGVPPSLRHILTSTQGFVVCIHSVMGDGAVEVGPREVRLQFDGFVVVPDRRLVPAHTAVDVAAVAVGFRVARPEFYGLVEVSDRLPSYRPARA